MHPAGSKTRGSSLRSEARVISRVVDKESHNHTCASPLTTRTFYPSNRTAASNLSRLSQHATKDLASSPHEIIGGSRSWPGESVTDEKTRRLPAFNPGVSAERKSGFSSERLSARARYFISIVSRSLSIPLGNRGWKSSPKKRILSLLNLRNRKFWKNSSLTYSIFVYHGIFSWMPRWKSNVTVEFERTQAISLLSVSFTRVQIDFAREQIHGGL